MTESLADARAWFAEDLRIAAAIGRESIVTAFANVPRERFVGPPPWRVGTRQAVDGRPFGYRTFADDPRVLYHDVIVALDEQNEINNGQPSLWARMFDELAPSAGERALHIGCGTGYYSAVLAELIGVEGSVRAVDINERLVARAKAALTPWPNIAAIQADGLGVEPDSFDLIIVCAGVTHPMVAWLDGLRRGGRLIFPLTAEFGPSRSGSGAMLYVSRATDDRVSARFLGSVAFIHFQGGRDAEANKRLIEAMRKGPSQMASVKSVRREIHEEDETCWFHGSNVCLSLRER